MMSFPSTSWRRFLIEEASRQGLRLTIDHAALFEAYALELLAWNRTINITAITDPQQIAVRHFVDSLVSSAYIPENATLLDVGSGGGFPGIPLALFRPDLRVTLLDASRKRVNFQRAVLRRLALSNVICIEAKLEDLLRQGREPQRFDVVVSRAFAAFDRWIPNAFPLVTPGGKIIAMIGSIEDAALQRLKEAVLGAAAGIESISYRLSTDIRGESRNLLILSLKKT